MSTKVKCEDGCDMVSSKSRLTTTHKCRNPVCYNYHSPRKNLTKLGELGVAVATTIGTVAGATMTTVIGHSVSIGLVAAFLAVWTLIVVRGAGDIIADWITDDHRDRLDAVNRYLNGSVDEDGLESGVEAEMREAKTETTLHDDDDLITLKN